MNNITKLCIKSIMIMMLCCLLKIEAKPLSEQKMVSEVVSDLSVDEQRQAIMDSTNLILDNKVSPEQTEDILKDLFDQVSKEDVSIQMQAMESLQSIVEASQNPETVNAFIIQCTNFLENTGLIEKGIFVQNSKRKIQLFVLELLLSIVETYSAQDSSFQNVQVLDNLVNCLLGAFDNTIDAGKALILNILVVRESCVQSFNFAILEKEVELMISELNGNKYKFFHNDGLRILDFIISRELEELSKYTNLILEAVETHKESKKVKKAEL